MVERLRLFERNRVPLGFRVLGLAMYFQILSLRRKARHFIAVDETCVNVNGEQYWVYSALDIDKNELISMKVYPTLEGPSSESFIRSVLKCCEGKPKFIVDNASWLRDALTQLGLAHKH